MNLNLVGAVMSHQLQIICFSPPCIWTPAHVANFLHSFWAMGDVRKRWDIVSSSNVSQQCYIHFHSFKIIFRGNSALPYSPHQKINLKRHITAPHILSPFFSDLFPPHYLKVVCTVKFPLVLPIHQGLSMSHSEIFGFMFSIMYSPISSDTICVGVNIDLLNNEDKYKEYWACTHRSKYLIGCLVFWASVG